MNILVDEHRQLLDCLLNHQVNFMLIGGYAVIYHGYERTTGDMDIWLEPENDNKDKLLNALTEFGIMDEDVEKMKALDFYTPQVFYFGAKPRRVDFLVFKKLGSIPFDEAHMQAKHFLMQNKQVPVIHYHHLIATKILTGRTQDKADIEELQRINKYKDNSQ